MRLPSIRLAAVLTCITSIASGADAPRGPTVDVTAFGGIPNDGKDDTAAIERAVEYAQSKAIRLRPPQSSYVGCAPAVHFPSGHYHLSKTIGLGGYATLSGDRGKSIIEWVGGEGEPMFTVACYTNRIENLKFIGGATHLLFHNRNINQTLIDIEGCEFQLARGYAIRAIPSAGADHLSTVLTISNCKFLNNHQCLETYCDYTNVVHTWVQMGQPHMADAAVFVNRSGWLFFQDMVGVPKAGVGEKRLVNARWVDNYSRLRATHTRFGGEDAGMPIVFNFAKFNVAYPYMGGGKIIITDSALHGGSHSPNACVIRLFEVPSLVVLRDTYGSSNNSLMLVDESLDLDAWLKSVPVKRRTFKFVIEPNLTWPKSLIESVPEQLRPFVNPLREMYYDKPASGFWHRGHVLLNPSVSNLSHVGLVNTVAGEPGQWGYFGKVSPFPMGQQTGQVLEDHKAKYTLAVPAGVKHFTALLTIGHSPVGGEGFTTTVVVLSLQAAGGKAYLTYSPLSSGGPCGLVLPQDHERSLWRGRGWRAHRR